MGFSIIIYGTKIHNVPRLTERGLSRSQSDGIHQLSRSRIRLPSCELACTAYAASDDSDLVLATGVWDSGSCLRGLTTFMVNKIRSPVTYWPVS